MIKDRLAASALLINLYLLFLQISLIIFKFPSLPAEIPLWYTRPWGSPELTVKTFILLVPLISLLILLINTALASRLSQKKESMTSYSLHILTIFLMLTSTAAVYRIIILESLPSFPWFLNPTVVTAIGAGFLISLGLTFPTLKLAQKFGFMDNPKTHKHPAMLLTRSVARGGALPIFAALALVSYFSFPLDRRIGAIFLAGFLSILVGLLDDKYDLNPYLRFSAQIAATLIVVAGGVRIDYINHPLGSGVLPLTRWVVPLSGTLSLQPLAFFSAVIWILWTMNMISWSNGVDGQFPLIVSVAAVVIGLLGLGDINQYRASIMAFALAGATLGTLPFSWHPSKILYGFGSTAIGLILASISILNGTKVATALLVLLVPSIDAAFAIFRRIRAGHSPFWGDRAHFHHKLLDLGFSQRQISLLYAGAGAILGLISIVSSGRGKLLAIITASGLFIFVLTLVNYRQSSVTGGKSNDDV
ncbi:MAG: undecaprenyl/decaprenyl-phosphate alpha-N-acetylglucosaminyl 1-phosphate transferase [Patescibacteria group bacterium]|nr:undecaprenyl/decaprenyl-phosphate alpha-N-acetylglucosaminyl 1-phosphate transferase [Patescibacteria group bacterium]